MCANTLLSPVQSYFVFSQITSLLVVPIEMDTVFESGMYSAALGISGKRFTESSQIRHAKFDQKYRQAPIPCLCAYFIAFWLGSRILSNFYLRQVSQVYKLFLSVL